jgi:hypothetical protein
MFNSRNPQPHLRALLAETVMCRRILAHSVMASGIGKALSGFVMPSIDPGGGSGM